MAGMLPQRVVRFREKLRRGESTPGRSDGPVAITGLPPLERSLRRVGVSPPPETQWRPLHELSRFCEAGTGGIMRFILGILIGCALTIGGAYIVDTVSTATAKPVMVNWDVVAKNLDTVTTLARAGWKKIAG